MTICLALATTASCASLRPAVAPASSEDEPEVALRVLEGRPDNLLLAVSYREASDSDVILLTRRGDDEMEQVLVEVPLQGRLLELARLSEIGLADETAVANETYRYRVDVLRGDEVFARSAEVSVDWGEPLLRPDRVVAREIADGVVEVEWSPPLGAALFVRDVLDDEKSVVRIDVPATASGRYLLRGLSPDGVYAFRVALGREEGDYVRYGAPSEEVYVTLSGSTREVDDAD